MLICFALADSNLLTKEKNPEQLKCHTFVFLSYSRFGELNDWQKTQGKPCSIYDDFSRKFRDIKCHTLVKLLNQYWHRRIRLTFVWLILSVYFFSSSYFIRLLFPSLSFSHIFVFFFHCCHCLYFVNDFELYACFVTSWPCIVS